MQALRPTEHRAADSFEAFVCEMARRDSREHAHTRTTGDDADATIALRWAASAAAGFANLKDATARARARALSLMSDLLPAVLLCQISYWTTARQG